MNFVENIKKTWSLVIIGPKNRWLDGLRTLLRTIPQVKQVDQVYNLYKGITLINKLPPDAIFVDADLPENMAWRFPGEIKAEYPEIPCILLVNDQKQKELAQQLGADAILLKGFNQQMLQLTLNKLLLPQTSIQTKPLGN